MKFLNRHEAGLLLAIKLKKYKKQKNTLIVALPRGGVPVGHIVSQKLDISLKTLVVRKLGSPFNRELAIGAIASGGTAYIDTTIMNAYGITQDDLRFTIQREIEEIERREKKFNATDTLQTVKNKTVILIDDGIATGADMRAAVQALHHQQIKKIIIAVPVCADDVYNEVKAFVDEIVALITPKNFSSVSTFYEHFPQVSDEEVLTLLKQ